MTDRLEEIRRRLKWRTQGQWEAHANAGYCGIMSEDTPLFRSDHATNADAALIAHAPADLAFLLPLAERAEKAERERDEAIAALRELAERIDQIHVAATTRSGGS